MIYENLNEFRNLVAEVDAPPTLQLIAYKVDPKMWTYPCHSHFDTF